MVFPIAGMLMDNRYRKASDLVVSQSIICGGTDHLPKRWDLHRHLATPGNVPYSSNMQGLEFVVSEVAICFEAQ